MKVSGPNDAANRAYAAELMRRLKHIPGIADLRLQQSESYPSLQVNVDRKRAAELGITERDVTSSLGASLAGTSQTAPTYWLNPANGVSYSVVGSTPQYRMSSIAQLEALPITGSNGHTAVLGGIASLARTDTADVVSHYNITPTLTCTPTSRAVTWAASRQTSSTSSKTLRSYARKARPSACTARSPRCTKPFTAWASACWARWC